MSAISAAAVLLGVLFLVTGITHFALPDYYRSLVPRWIPRPGVVVAGTGVLEILVGCAILLPATRRVSAGAAALLICAYLVAHVDAAVRARSDAARLMDRPVGAAARLVVNTGYLVWALIVSLTAS